MDHSQRRRCITNQEQGVAQSTLVGRAIGTPRRLDETVGIGVDAKGENLEMSSGEFRDRGAVARPEIDD